LLFVLLVETFAAGIAGAVAGARASSFALWRRAAPPIGVLLVVAAGVPARIAAGRGDLALLALGASGAALSVAFGSFAAGIARITRSFDRPEAPRRPGLPALAGIVGGLALPGAALFLAAPLLRLAERPAEVLPWLLRISPVTLVGGSLLGIDILRTGPLYEALPIAAYYPYAYPPFWPSAAAILAGGLALSAAAAVRRRAPPPKPPETPASVDTPAERP
jgi:hypothetical protein